MLIVVTKKIEQGFLTVLWWVSSDCVCIGYDLNFQFSQVALGRKWFSWKFCVSLYARGPTVAIGPSHISGHVGLSIFRIICQVSAHIGRSQVGKK